MYEKVTAVWVHDNKSEVCALVEKFEAAGLSLREILNLADYMLRVGTIFHLILRELGVHLV